MPKLPSRQEWRQWRYILKHDILNRSNLLSLAVIIMALVWLFSAVDAITRNHKQQRRLDAKLRQAKILELEAANLAFEQDYYRSQEYQELALRQKTDLVLPGEKVLVLAPYPDWVRQKNTEIKQKNQPIKSEKPSNLRQWMNFFFGAKANTLKR